MLHPTKYADILGQKIEKHGATIYLVNTGWVGGKYGVGSRISLEGNRRIIDAIFGWQPRPCPIYRFADIQLADPGKD